MTFESWLEAVDKIFIKHTGLDRDSFPDQDYWNMWEDEYTPEEAFATSILNEYGVEGAQAFGLAVV